MEITDVFVEIGLDCETGEMGYKLIIYYKKGYNDVFEISFEKVKDIEKMREMLRGKKLQTKIEEIVEIGSWKRNVFLD